MKRSLFYIICFVILIFMTIGCSSSKEYKKDFKIVSQFSINKAEEIFNKEFSVEEILYNDELKIYDILLLSKENDLKVWCQVENGYVDKKESTMKIITAVHSNLIKYELKLPKDNTLRKAQTNVLLTAKSMTYTNNIVIVSDTYDNKSGKYRLKLMTDNNDNIEFEIDLINGNMKML